MKTYLLMINASFVFFSTSLAAQTVCNDPLGCQVETPASDVLCWPSFVLEREKSGYPKKCAAFDAKDEEQCKSNYIGCYQSLEAQAIDQADKYNKLMQRLNDCRNSRGKRC